MATISSLGVGSGLDLNGLLDQLASAEREKLAPIAQKQQSYEAKISAFGKLEGALSQFRDAANELGKAEKLQAMKTTVTGSAVTATAGADTATGRYAIDVAHQARASSVATQGLEDKTAELGAGTLRFTLGDGEEFTVEVGPEHSSLEGIRDAINEADAGVRAAIVNDGSDQPYRLALTAGETGTDAAIAGIDFGALADSLALDVATEVTAQNAALTVNGIAVESQSNAVEGAIQGVTLQIAESGEATLEIGRDTKAVTGAVTDFVDAYNHLQETIAGLTRYDAESGEAGELLGNDTLRRVESRLRDVLGTAVEGSFGRLSDIGIRRQVDGNLEIDDTRLNEVAATDPAGLSRLFAGDGEAQAGLVGRLDRALGGMLEEQGLLENATDGLNTTLAALDERFARTEERIDTTIARYRKQFSQLDSMIAQMNSTSSYLTQQFEMLNARSGG